MAVDDEVILRERQRIAVRHTDLLAHEIEVARQAGRSAQADEAQQLLDEAVNTLVGWHMENVDEITVMTKDYDIELDVFQVWRARIAAMIQRLRTAP